MIEYYLNSETQILEVTYKDDICIKDLLEYGEMIKKNRTYPRNLKILTDATFAKYILEPTDVNLMLKALKEQIQPYESVKSAVFHNKPRETAISHLVNLWGPIPNYQHKVFSTKEAALLWLLYEDNQ
jgi:hypothetical protein